MVVEVLAPRANVPRILSAFVLFLLSSLLPAQELRLPLQEGSLRFAVIGDAGTGKRAQYEVAEQLALFHRKSSFELVLMLGDNLYGREGPGDYKKKFELPYKPLLDADVKFYAALGNHDNPKQRFYSLFNMGRKRFYAFRPAPQVQLFALDSTRMNRAQLSWLEEALRSSDSRWKICFFHKPIYSSGKRHGSSMKLRRKLEPLFVRYGVNVVFAGHDHVYERLKPQNGIYYFVSGAAGKLRKRNVRRTYWTAEAFDTDRHFLLVEIAGDKLHFQAVSRTGETVDSGVLVHPGSAPASAEEVAAAGQRPAQSLALPGERRLKNIRQLTFGGQNAEAYLSPDGKRIIFQATRDGLKCDQIFIMDADGSDVHMVSTGKGRTTCAYFLPDGKHFLYASTHEASTECPSRPDRSRGYVWPVYPGYDVYLARDNGKIVRKLTDQPGYDAEATVSWDTGRIVWTALREGDLDMYSMDLAGKQVKRLTDKPGYDGGAFYSPDGTKLVWRAHRPPGTSALAEYRSLLDQNLTAPMKMELFVADADGLNPRQITSFGCASFAPFFTPDGRNIIFSSNKNRCDSRFFELFLVSMDGSGLEQVTHSGGFNSFPVFSPDGKKLLFVSDRNARERYEFNIFIADWQP